MFKTALLAAVAAQENDKSNHWVVLVAGSKTWSNYRHQSDTCHAYQIAKNNGIPEDQIIHIAFDDIANNSRNPFPGQIFNKPTEAGTPGVDVYDGCKIDYSGNDATAATTLGVLKGDSSVGPKYLKSDKDSQVFFYFADHGAPGLVAMPVGPYLYADQLHEAFTYMHENDMYNQMTAYVEACESGSMFENILETDTNIYALSASNSKESSWAAYCSPDDKIDGKSVGSCLGDLFSINWMEDADAADMKTETLQEQFETVKTKTTRSPVLQWGELDWTSEPIGMFEGSVDSAERDLWTVFGSTAKNYAKDVLNWDAVEGQEKAKFSVDSRDVNLHYAYRAVMTNPTPENHQALMEEIEHRMTVDDVFKNLNPDYKIGSNPTITDYECYRELIAEFEGACFSFEEYSMKYLGQLATECEGFKYFPGAKQQVIARFGEVCSSIVA